MHIVANNDENSTVVNNYYFNWQEDAFQPMAKFQNCSYLQLKTQ